MAKIIDIKPRNITRVGSQAELLKRWEAGLSPVQREGLEAARRKKEIRRQLKNALAKQKRAVQRQAMARTPQSQAAAAAGGGGGAQVSRSIREAPRAASVVAGSSSGSSRPRRPAK